MYYQRNISKVFNGSSEIPVKWDENIILFATVNYL